MPAQVAILSRKVLLDTADVEWISEPMYWGGYKSAELFLEAHGLGDVASQVDVELQGATTGGENANWQSMTVNGSALSAKGISKFTTTDIYPYVRVKVLVSGGAPRLAEVSLAGQLFEE